MNSCFLVRPEQGFGQTSGTKQGEAQQNCVPHAAPEGGGDVCTGWNALDQDGVDADADHDEKRLEAQRQQ